MPSKRGPLLLVRTLSALALGLLMPAQASDAGPAAEKVPLRLCSGYLGQRFTETSTVLQREHFRRREAETIEIEITTDRSAEGNREAARAACRLKTRERCQASHVPDDLCRFAVHVGPPVGWEAAEATVEAPKKIRARRRRKGKRRRRRHRRRRRRRRR